MSNKMSERIPERMPDEMPDRMSDRMANICQIKCQKECQNVECIFNRMSRGGDHSKKVIFKHCYVGSGFSLLCEN